MELNVGLDNSSFDRAGITKDCQEAVCEYIWNGFEAMATEVEVSFEGEPLREAMSIVIKDNGDGIEYDSLKRTFGTFLSSIKNATSIRIKSQANKGKGRFSYICLSSSAHWSTIYRDGEKLCNYEISTNSTDKSKFLPTAIREIENGNSTGTTVELPLYDQSLVSGKLSHSEIKQKLFREFSWFLFLNKRKNFKLKYCGAELDYNQYVDLELSSETDIEINDETFHVHLIVWKKKIDNPSKIYYLSDMGIIHAASNTGFNKNTVEFNHNVFVTSNYINAQNTSHLQSSDSVSDDVNFSLANEESNDSRKIFRELKQKIEKTIETALKSFLVRQADKQITDMEGRGTLPAFPQDEYGQLRKRDFENIARELYCVEPKIFYRLNETQEKSLLGFMNLLLESEERENLLVIVEQVVNLSSEQRENFAQILRKTKLQFIVDAIEIIDKRIIIVEQLKELIHDLKKFCNERDHIQKIIERHFWLFGEQYHLLTADKSLEKTLAEFEKITEQKNETSEISMSKSESRLRPDIFLYSQQTREDSSSEMLIVELKSPSVTLSLEVFNQITKYANTVRKEPRFNGNNRFWKFYAVCATVDDDVRILYDNFKQYGKMGLANKVGNFEIYALSWDDVFQAFEARHSPLLDKLRHDFTQAVAELEDGNAKVPSRELVNRISKQFIVETV